MRNVGKAWEDGQSRPSGPSDASVLPQFAEALEASVSRRLAPQEWSFIKSCSSRQNEALQAARENRLEEAQQQVDEVQDRVRSRSLSQQGQMLIQVFLEPVEAYLCYKLQDYGQARELVLHASALDQRLATEFGYPLLSAHRLQLAHNLLRIHARMGEDSQAVHLGAAFLDYLELRVEPATNALLSARAVLDCVPDAIPQYYFDKVCGELALILADSADQGLFQPLAHHAGAEKCPVAGFCPRAHAWLAMKQLALTGQVEASLEKAADLLRQGRSTAPPLWFAAIIEAARLCRSLGAQGSKLADRMIAKASTFSDAPWALKQAAGKTSAIGAGSGSHAFERSGVVSLRTKPQSRKVQKRIGLQVECS